MILLQGSTYFSIHFSRGACILVNASYFNNMFAISDTCFYSEIICLDSGLLKYLLKFSGFFLNLIHLPGWYLLKLYRYYTAGHWHMNQ